MVSTSDIQDYDLVIVGAGSGNALLGPDFDGWRVAIVERDRFGGTCLNRGCIPSKMLIHAADVALEVRDADRFGLKLDMEPRANWPAILARVFGRLDPLADSGLEYRCSLPNVDVYHDSARFVGVRELEVGGQRLRGRDVVLAVGARPFVPAIPGLDTVPFHTSDTVMRIEALPEHLIVLGAGFIAAELGHVFEGLGSKVTIVNRGRQLLGQEDHEISARFTEVAADRFDLVLGATVDRVRRTPGGIAVDVTDESGTRSIEGDVLLVATGRVPNSDLVDAAAGGLAVDARGYVTVDDTLRTSQPGVFALGDINGRAQLKHIANTEARVVAHNLLHPDDLSKVPKRTVPHAVFTSPQIGSVGLTEQAARDASRPYVKAIHEYSATAYGWALEDTTGFVKLLADPATRQLIGAHIIGPQASTLIQLLIQGMHLGATVDQLAREQIYVHPALPEVVENALLKVCAQL